MYVTCLRVSNRRRHRPSGWQEPAAAGDVREARPGSARRATMQRTDLDVHHIFPRRHIWCKIQIGLKGWDHREHLRFRHNSPAIMLLTDLICTNLLLHLHAKFRKETRTRTISQTAQVISSKVSSLDFCRPSQKHYLVLHVVRVDRNWVDLRWVVECNFSAHIDRFSPLHDQGNYSAMSGIKVWSGSF